MILNRNYFNTPIVQCCPQLGSVGHTAQWRSTPSLSGLRQINETDVFNQSSVYKWCDCYSTWQAYMSHLEKTSMELSEILFFSHKFFSGFGGSSRISISRITFVRTGSDLLSFLLMHKSKSHCRYT